MKALGLVVLVGAPAALAAGYLQGVSTPPPPAAKVRAAPPALIVKPGWGAKEAAAYMARLNAPPPPPPPVYTGPPPTDVAVYFRREYGGVLNPTGPAPVVFLGPRRTLKIGDVYRDGWKLTSINASTATLSKGTETRRIGLFSPPVPAENAQNNAANTPVIPLSLSNGLREGQLTGTQLNTIESAASRLGLTPAQRLQLRAQLTQGTVNQQSIIQLIQGLRPPPSAAAITAFVNALGQAGVIPQQVANQLSQTLPQMISNQAPANINRGPAAIAAAPAPGANRGGGPGGGPGGGNRGGPGALQNFGGPGGGQNFGGPGGRGGRGG